MTTLDMSSIPLTIAVLADRLGLGAHALYPYVREGLLKTFKIGNTSVVSLDEADRFEAAWRAAEYDGRKNQGARR
jgi:hypothetical protein